MSLIRLKQKKSQNMNVIIFLVYVCLFHTGQSQDAAGDAEVLPASLERENRRIRLFWSVMHEVCQTFCVWKTFCNAFCALFSPSREPSLKGDSIEVFLKENAPQTQWLYDSVSQICEEDETCVKNCLNMETENDAESPWPQDQTPANLYAALFQIANQYFKKCAKMNEKTLPRDEWLSADTFCKFISLRDMMVMGTCISALTE